MKASIKLNPMPQISKRIGIDRRGHVQKFWTAMVLRRIQRFMPFRTGETIKLTIAQTDINTPEIITDTPNGRYLFYGVSKTGKPLNYTKTKNPDAGPFWDRALKAAEMSAMISELQAYIKRRSGE